MADAHSAVAFTDEERAYLESQGQTGLGEATPPVADDQREEPSHDDEPDAPAPGQQDPEPDGSDASDDDGEEQGEQGDGRKKPRRVAYRHFVAEREAKAKAEREVQEYRDKLELAQRDQAVLGERMRAFAEHQQRQQYEAQQRAQAAAAAQQGQDPRIRPEPDPEQDPYGNLLWQRDQRSLLEERLARMEQGFTQAAQHQQQTAQVQHIENAYRSDFQTATQQMPAYRDAYEFMTRIAAQDIQIQNGNRLQPHEVAQHLKQQELALAQAAMQRGIRPAAMILQMAQARGWKPAEQAPPQPAQPDPVAAQAQIDAAARAQDQNRSLSTAGRPGGGSTAMTIDKFARMSPDEANAWMAQNPDAFARLAGATQ